MSIEERTAIAKELLDSMVDTLMQEQDFSMIGMETSNRKKVVARTTLLIRAALATVYDAPSLLDPSEP